VNFSVVTPYTFLIPLQKRNPRVNTDKSISAACHYHVVLAVENLQGIPSMKIFMMSKPLEPTQPDLSITTIRYIYWGLFPISCYSTIRVAMVTWSTRVTLEFNFDKYINNEGVRMELYTAED